MRKLRYGVAIFPLLLGGIACAQTLKTVDGHPITEAMVVAANPAAKNDPALRKKTLDILVQRQEIADYAQKAGILDTAQIDAALAVDRQQMEAQAGAEYYLRKHQIPAGVLHQAYQKYLQSLPKRELRFRYIVVSSVSEADKLLHELRTGASFDQLASEYSLAENAPIGGESGWVPEDKIPAPFLPHIGGVKEGTVVGPIAVPQGYAIVQNLGTRKAPIPSFAEVEPALRKQAENQEIESFLRRLNKGAGIPIPFRKPLKKS